MNQRTVRAVLKWRDRENTCGALNEHLGGETPDRVTQKLLVFPSPDYYRHLWKQTVLSLSVESDYECRVDFGIKKMVFAESVLLRHEGRACFVSIVPRVVSSIFDHPVASPRRVRERL